MKDQYKKYNSEIDNSIYFFFLTFLPENTECSKHMVPCLDILETK